MPCLASFALTMASMLGANAINISTCLSNASRRDSAYSFGCAARKSRAIWNI